MIEIGENNLSMWSHCQVREVLLDLQPNPILDVAVLLATWSGQQSASLGQKQ